MFPPPPLPTECSPPPLFSASSLFRAEMGCQPARKEPVEQKDCLVLFNRYFQPDSIRMHNRTPGNVSPRSLPMECPPPLFSASSLFHAKMGCQPARKEPVEQKDCLVLFNRYFQPDSIRMHKRATGNVPPPCQWNIPPSPF
ncbi:hypothetical protein CDAR_88961 [Caerostris darwini]|uniref:Uncharacterized protein n=1 Tax=Caerostris darwini TaxID=1538125 RepID=A0AAV4UZN6_9ARAC|nr:hypothetical protein CDAR_88961 [Caerostris darwini]